MDWPRALIASIGTIAVFAVASVAIWQGFKTWQAKVKARVSLAQDEAYRKLAAEASAAQQAVAAELAAVRERLAAIEQLLREVG
jgi:vacuolar-type H+-ATPase subunit E/Vma4